MFGKDHYHHHHWAGVACRGWANASAGRLQVCLSCAVFCQIILLQYVSMSSLHLVLFLEAAVLSQVYVAFNIFYQHIKWEKKPVLKQLCKYVIDMTYPASMKWLMAASSCFCPTKYSPHCSSSLTTSWGKA